MTKNAIVRNGLWLVGLIVLLGVGAAAYGLNRTAEQSSERADCPGKVVCPLTGDEVCKDQCPLLDASRPDCPGKIECPLSGDLVCRDECPLGIADQTPEAETATPACCLDEPKPTPACCLDEK